LNLVRLPISPPARPFLGEPAILCDGPCPPFGREKSFQATLSRLTRNHAAYIAGSASNVSTVATISPPMMATAMGPQNTDRDRGIMASTAADAVNTIGRSRRTADSTIAFQAGIPLA